jgi:hypothetical protein
LEKTFERTDFVLEQRRKKIEKQCTAQATPVPFQRYSLPRIEEKKTPFLNMCHLFVLEISWEQEFIEEKNERYLLIKLTEFIAVDKNFHGSQICEISFFHAVQTSLCQLPTFHTLLIVISLCFFQSSTYGCVF